MKFAIGIWILVVIVGSVTLTVDCARPYDRPCREHAARKYIDVSRVKSMSLERRSSGSTCQSACALNYNNFYFDYSEPNYCCCGFRSSAG